MFATLTDKITSPSFNIYIENLEVSDNHWRSTNYIAKFADDIDLTLYGMASFQDVEKDLVQIFLGLNKQNPRIEQIKFFGDDAYKHTLVCVCISDINTFKPENFLTRNIVVNFKKQNKVLLITDITTAEWNDRDKKLHPQWKLHESITKRYDKYKKLFL